MLNLQIIKCYFEKLKLLQLCDFCIDGQ
jgi:CheY-like chemotaxis protein